MIADFFKNLQGLSLHNKLILKVTEMIYKNAYLKNEMEKYASEWFKNNRSSSPSKDKEESLAFCHFMNSFLYEIILENGKNTLHHLASEHANEFSPAEQNHLKNISKHFYSAFDVVEVIPGEFVFLRDLVADKVYKVFERSLSQNVEIGSVIFSRLSLQEENIGVLLYTDGGFIPPYSYHLKRSFIYTDWKANDSLNSYFFHNVMITPKDPEDKLTENLTLMKKTKKIFKKMQGEKFNFNQVEADLKAIDFSKAIEPQIKSYTDAIRKHFSEPEAENNLKIFYNYMMLIAEHRDESIESEMDPGPMEKMLVNDFIQVSHQHMMEAEAHKADMKAINRRTKAFQKKWLDEAQKELLGKTPRQIILSERKERGDPNLKIEYQVSVQRLDSSEEIHEIKARAIEKMEAAHYKQAFYCCKN